MTALRTPLDICFAALLAALVSLVPAPSVADGSRGRNCASSTRVNDPSSIEITRENHRFRHWQWNGIFPIYGGWIPDPHFLQTAVFDFPEVVRGQLRAEQAGYQGFDVNPWFKDETSEVVLAIEIDGQTAEYQLQAPSDGNPLAISDADILSIPDDAALLFFTVLRWRHACFVRIEFPIATAVASTLCEGSTQFDGIVESLRHSGYAAPRDRLCGNTNRHYQAFYARFGSCTDPR